MLHHKFPCDALNFIDAYRPLFHTAQNALLVTQQMRDSENIRRKRFITDARV